MIDDMVGTGKSLAANVKRFHDENIGILETDKPIVLAFALIGTNEGQKYMMKKLSDLSYKNLDFRVGELLDERASLFAEPTGVFASVDERDRAKALAERLGGSIYKRAPLGFGGQALALVFPTTVPNNSLPILHSRGKGAGTKWSPLFERIVN